MKNEKNDINELLPLIYQHIERVVKTSTLKAVEIALKTASNTSFLNEEFLSAVQAAEFLKLKLNTIYAKVKTGELPYHKMGEKGRKLLFCKTDLEGYLSTRRTKSHYEISQEANKYINVKTLKS